MSKICSSRNLLDLEQLNIKLSDAVLLLELSFECFYDSFIAGEEEKSNTASHLVDNAINLLKTSLNDYRVFEDWLYSETDINCYVLPDELEDNK